MAVEQMKLISLFGKYARLNNCIAGLIDCGCFHPENAANATQNSKGFTPISEVNPVSNRLHRLSEVLTYCGIDPESIEQTETKGRDSQNVNVDEVLTDLSDKLHELQKKRENLKKQIESCNATLSALHHFEGLTLDLSEAENSEFIKIKFGKIPADGYSKLSDYVDNPYLMFHVCSHDKNSYWGVYITPATHEEEIDRIFASLFFEQLTLPDGFGSPASRVAEYEKRIEDLKSELEKTEQNIEWYYKNRGSEVKTLYTQLQREFAVYEYRRFAVRYNGQFASVIGWVPARMVKKLSAHTEDLGDYSVTEVTSGTTHLGISDLTPPTRMKNKKIFRPFEFYVEIYGVPAYNEIDPTAFVAITYTLLYGIMFADLGQGLALAAAGLFMWYKMKMPLGKILVPCGLSGAVFGLVFGSVFGYENWLDPMYHALGFKEKPIEVMASATTLLGFSVGIGIVLILLAMFVGVVSNIKKKNLGMALFGPNGICGILLYGSAVALVLGMVANIPVPTVPVVIFGMVIPMFLIFFHAPLCSLISGNGSGIESVGDFILESIFELLETVLSYFTNTVSFLRVGAFVLIHAGMMMAFTSLSAIVGGGVAGAIMMIFGNVFVIALEGLLVGIQVLRLEFYEMFSRFYDGDGHPYQPLTKNGILNK